MADTNEVIEIIVPSLETCFQIDSLAANANANHEHQSHGAIRTIIEYIVLGSGWHYDYAIILSLHVTLNQFSTLVKFTTTSSPLHSPALPLFEKTCRKRNASTGFIPCNPPESWCAQTHCRSTSPMRDASKPIGIDGRKWTKFKLANSSVWNCVQCRLCKISIHQHKRKCYFS